MSDLIWGTVKTTSPLTIQLDLAASNAVAALALSSYAPAVNDRVVVSRVGRQYVAMGKAS